MNTGLDDESEYQQSPEEDIGYPGARVMDDGETPVRSARNQSLVLAKTVCAPNC